MERGSVRCLPRQPGEGVDLVAQHRPAQPGVGDRIVHRILRELVAFDQPVVGVGREGQGRQHQRVHHRQRPCGQSRQRVAQDRQVVRQDVVTGDALGAADESVQSSGGEGPGTTLLPSEDPVVQHRTDRIQAPATVGFDVDEQRLCQIGVRARVGQRGAGLPFPEERIEGLGQQGGSSLQRRCNHRENFYSVRMHNHNDVFRFVFSAAIRIPGMTDLRETGGPRKRTVGSCLRA